MIATCKKTLTAFAVTAALAAALGGISSSAQAWTYYPETQYRAHPGFYGAYGAYGAYGYSNSPFFASSILPWLNRGGVFAVAHVRGGGERGEAWHLAGMKATKQHTIDDFVAGAQYLIDQKYTSPAPATSSSQSVLGYVARIDPSKM